MKKIAPLFVLLIALSFTAEARNSLLYRVQIGSYKRADTPKDIRKIEKLKKYLLPEGYYCFFKGGYYHYFEGASRVLESVKEMGYDKALIRVYKDEKLLSYKDAEKYVMMETYNPTPMPANEKVDKQLFSIQQKRTFENRIILYKEITSPKLFTPGMDTVVVDEKFKFSSLWKRKGKKNEEDENKNKEEIVTNEEEADTMVIDPELMAAVQEAVVEEKAEEIIEENDDELVLPDNFKVDDIPYFKIYLASTEQGKPIPTSVEYVPDIVYTYNKKKMILYAVGYFKNSVDAQADLTRYVNKGFYNAKIIAIYKTIVVSQRMGDEILSRVKN
jgi:hypothetical protein